ncbi:MAG: ABC transporter permease [Gemmatimonadetes bacterium]|nr:ABC transporter permease [Gemmatimonadota bacterium]
MNWRRWINLPVRGPRDVARDVDTELQFHLDARTADLLAQGFSEEAARAKALADFGDVAGARRYATQMDRATLAAGNRRDRWGAIRQDITYAWRGLRRAPAFTATTLVTLALGIGATTAIFSLVHSIVLRPLPYPNPDQLYRVWSANASAGSPEVGMSAMDLDDFRAQRSAVADLGGFFHQAGSTGLDFTGDGEPERLAAVFVTPGFFSTLRVAPLHGRLPREDELVRGGPDRILVLTEPFWRRRFGADPSVVGRAVTINGSPFQVIGVLPAGFNYPSATADVYASFSIFTDDQIPRLRFVRLLGVVARAREGVAPAQVVTELSTIATRLAARYPENAAWGGVTVRPLQAAIVGDVGRTLWLLLGAVGLLLLIACVNVASLQLARATARAGEVAVRTALGASRGRLVQQLVTESLVLASLGGALGVALAIGLVRLVRVAATDPLPRGSEVTLDGNVLAFATALSVFAGLLFGAAPAISASAGTSQALRSARSATGLRTRGRRMLVVAEVTLAMVLVIAGGLMVRSLRALTGVDLGFKPDHLLVVSFSLSSERHGDNYTLVYERILRHARAIPGVVAAGAVKEAPFRGAGERASFRLPGMVVPAGEESPTAALLHVSDGYFAALGAEMEGGREFLPTDRRDAPPVVVVNRAFARRWFPGRDAVGERLLFGVNAGSEIVGVVEDIRQSEVASEAEPTIYVHEMQQGRVGVNLVVRTVGPPLAAAAAVRHAIREADPLQAIRSTFSMEDAVREALARPRMLVVLLGAFGILGLLLGAVGLYGVLAYLVQQRRKDIGVRLALGASHQRVLGGVLVEGLRLAALGVACGTVIALGVGRWLSSILYGVGANDPMTLAVVSVVLLATAGIASIIPARRAAAINLVSALRAD